MSFVDEQTNTVELQRVLQEIKQMLSKLNDHNGDKVIDSVIIGFVGNNLTKRLYPVMASHKVKQT
jgi:hypothetical protein